MKQRWTAPLRAACLAGAALLLAACQMAGAPRTVTNDRDTSDRATLAPHGTAAAASPAATPGRGGTIGNADDVPAPGCGPVELPELGPAEAGGPARGFPRHPLILGSGGEASTEADVERRGFNLRAPAGAPDGLELTLLYVSERSAVDEVRMYYAAEPITETMRLPDVIAGRGVLVIQRRSIGHDAALVQSEVGDRATIVKVGSLDAALVWTNPIAGTLRTYNLYWSDGTYDWSVISGLETPEETVALARSMMCA